MDHVCNLTDVDDKIIAKMLSEGKSFAEVTHKYTEAFFEDLEVGWNSIALTGALF